MQTSEADFMLAASFHSSSLQVGLPLSPFLFHFEVKMFMEMALLSSENGSIDTYSDKKLADLE